MNELKKYTGGYEIRSRYAEVVDIDRVNLPSAANTNAAISETDRAVQEAL